MSLIEIYFKLFFQAVTPIIYSFQAFNSILIKIIFIIGVAYLGQIILNTPIDINKRLNAGEKMTRKVNKKDQHFAEMQKKIIELMETAGADWTKQWITAGPQKNISSKKEYQGMNQFWLSMSGFSSNEWGTFKQWSDKGCKIIKGSKGRTVTFFSQLEKTRNLTDAQEELKARGGTPIVWFEKTSTVFNAEQIEGYEVPETQKVMTPELKKLTIKNAEKFIANTQAKIHIGGDAAFYRPSADQITMPSIDSFFTDTAYYSTLLHELTHWTGHPSREDRDLSGGFGSERYAREELIAEIGSAFLSQILNIEKVIRDDHAKYLNNWIKVIKEDKNALKTAFSKAQKSVNFLRSLQAKEEKKNAA